jgi:2-oxo-4-hydroxy-4-carboxy-5-ureidoimidazoline decarboxylase
MTDRDVTAPGTLATFNALPAETAERELLACCAARRWAAAMVAGRPYDDIEALHAASDAVFATVTDADVAEALAGHPRIGERADGDGREAAWSRREQSRVADADAQTLDALAAGNAAYEQRFGRVFLICASGLSAEQMLAVQRTRLGHDEVTETAVVKDELRKITRLRMERLMHS